MATPKKNSGGNDGLGWLLGLGAGALVIADSAQKTDKLAAKDGTIALQGRTIVDLKGQVAFFKREAQAADGRELESSRREAAAKSEAMIAKSEVTTLRRSLVVAVEEERARGTANDEALGRLHGQEIDALKSTQAEEVAKLRAEIETLKKAK